MSYITSTLIVIIPSFSHFTKIVQYWIFSSQALGLGRPYPLHPHDVLERYQDFQELEKKKGKTTTSHLPEQAVW